MSKKPYITTAIPYANAKPHIGNALDYLLADIWRRYQRQLGHEVRMQVGTDEHGNKIAMKAEESGKDPQTYVDETHVAFKLLMEKVGAEYTDFVRTSDAHHVSSAQYIWQKLAPYIYKGHYEGWYCVGCEAFVSDKEAAENNGICPDHNIPYERLSEENYYFKITEFAARIIEAIESNKLVILPAFRRNEVLNLLKNDLTDLSISRPRKHLSWGIPVPNDPDQVMYVWVDALSNYLTVLGYPEDQTWSEYWPADVQVIGKDILRFHAIIWPAMLMALELPLPKKLLVHGFIDSGGKKMSKSIGNVIDPVEVIDSYGIDAFRYYMSRHIPTQDDGDFTWEKFETAYNNELGNDLGNLVQRIASMVTRYQAGVIGEVNRGEHDMQLYRDAMEALKFNEALDEVWTTVRTVNQYLDSVKPWMVAKTKDTDPDAAEHLAEILETCVGSLRQIALLVTPFMPDAAAKIMATFEGGVVHDQGPLFPRIYLHTPDPRAPKDTAK